MEKNKNVSWLDDMEGYSEMNLDDMLDSKEFNESLADLQFMYDVTDTITSEDLKEWGMYPHY